MKLVSIFLILLSISNLFAQSHLDYYRMFEKPDNWLEIATSNSPIKMPEFKDSVQSAWVVLPEVSYPVSAPSVIYVQPFVSPQPYQHTQIIRSFNGNFINTEIRTPNSSVQSITILPNPTPVIRRP